MYLLKLKYMLSDKQSKIAKVYGQSSNLDASTLFTMPNLVFMILF